MRGLGVLINDLFGNDETIEVIRKALGVTIEELSLGEGLNNDIVFKMKSGYKFTISDEGQSCCESRYITTDDNLSNFIGAELRDIEIANAPNVHDEYGEHEVQFLWIKTSLGVITFETHNEHNGYYGGFSICARVLE